MWFERLGLWLRNGQPVVFDREAIKNGVGFVYAARWGEIHSAPTVDILFRGRAVVSSDLKPFRLLHDVICSACGRLPSWRAPEEAAAFSGLCGRCVQQLDDVRWSLGGAA